MERLPRPEQCLPRQLDGVRLDRISVEALVALRRMEELEDFRRITCRPVLHRSDEQLHTIYQRALEDPAILTCGIYLPEHPCPVGKLTASDYNPRNRSAELGYYLSKPFRGKGCMGKALFMFCGILLLEWRLNKVYAQTGAFNQPSIRLLERLGFQRDGVLRQHHVLEDKTWDDYLYSLLRQEYPAEVYRAGVGSQTTDRIG